MQIIEKIQTAVNFETEGLLYSLVIEPQMIADSANELCKILAIDPIKTFEYESYYGMVCDYSENEISLDMLDNECIAFLSTKYFSDAICYQTDLIGELEDLIDEKPELYARFAEQYAISA
jgi:RNA binding exosome subunit